MDLVNRIKRHSELGECIGYQKAVLDFQRAANSGMDVEEIWEFLVWKADKKADTTRGDDTGSTDAIGIE